MVVRRARRKAESSPREMWERGAEKALWEGGLRQMSVVGAAAMVKDILIDICERKFEMRVEYLSSGMWRFKLRCCLSWMWISAVPVLMSVFRFLYAMQRLIASRAASFLREHKVEGRAVLG